MNSIMHKGQSDTEYQIDKEAQDWLLLLSLENVSAKDRKAFEAWCEADVRHEAAYLRLEQIWSEVSEIEDLADLAPLDGLHTSFWKRVGDFFKSSASRPTWALPVALAVCLLLAAPMWLNTGPQGDVSTHYVTDVAETSSYVLEDGSVIALGPLSDVAVTYTADSRTATFTKGEAFFKIAKNPARPFVVAMGDSNVTVLGTSFNIRLYDGSTQVTVEEGLVAYTALTLSSEAKENEASGREKSPQRYLLEAGQQLVTSKDEEPVVGARNVGDIGAWRNGRLVYVDEALDNVVADINRYSKRVIKLVGPTDEMPMVSLSFRIDNIEAMLGTLENALPIHVENTGTNEIYITLKSKDKTRG